MCGTHPEQLTQELTVGIEMRHHERDANLRLIGLLEAFALIEGLELPNHYYQGQMATPGKVRNFVRNALAERINELRPPPAIPL